MEPLSVGPLTEPGHQDVAGRPRWRWRYLLWHTWPPAPTRQDLRDFMFTSLLASAVTLVCGAVAITVIAWGRFDVLERVWSRVDAGVLLAAVAIVPYYGFVYWDWQRKRVA